MQKLAEICVRRPVFATMLILSLTVVGLFSYNSLGVDLFPKIDLPTITVTVVNPVASSQEIETEITDKIEGAVNTISIVDGRYVETGDPVERRSMRQWMLKITEYAQALLDDLDEPGPDGQVLRPDLAVVDDPQDDESAESPSQVAKRLRTINGSIFGASVANASSCSRSTICPIPISANASIRASAPSSERRSCSSP